jgi:hypothetical protein
MIAGSFPAPDMPVYPRRCKPGRKRRAEQQMVDAQAGIPRTGVPEVILKRVDTFIQVLTCLFDQGGAACQDRDTIPAFLPMPDGVGNQPPEAPPRKIFRRVL